ncbi:uncharacterized protein AFUA_1G01580 [Aspergillus fumigatus Af293]|uniref:Uncharacterized protein n=2 Tax=Aspergillus fumigatus TaxID=746128 RepID=Q4WKR2_ASPFU|nr:hypothetical protein AFUA_1G01580 [Aspergillus fumigatus Af293]EAL87870.1 hypothetical protein AFUA_1G01580 [Aspergillus fumigatus Af293]EDP55503.1 hypothetical protein AFUB_001980 [Aspergillus fumigatus A1163]
MAADPKCWGEGSHCRSILVHLAMANCEGEFPRQSSVRAPPRTVESRERKSG